MVKALIVKVNRMVKHRMLGVALIGAMTGFFVLAGTVRAAGPAIADVNVVYTYLNSAEIAWTTDVTSTGTMKYGTTSGVYTGTVTTESGTVHRAYLQGLDTGTTYYYTITAAGLDGSTTTTSEQSFTTVSDAPRISQVNVTLVGSTKAVVFFTANTYAHSTLTYGPSATALTEISHSLIKNDSAGDTQFSMLLDNLKSNTVYYYQISANSTNAYGDPVKTFSTPVYSLKTTIVPVITSISPVKGKVGTTVTIKGKGFGSGMSKGHRPVDAIVAFGCSISRWDTNNPVGNAKNIKCLSKITSWTDTKITAKVLKGAVTGPVYIGKAVASNSSSLIQKSASIFTIKSPSFKVTK